MDSIPPILAISPIDGRYKQTCAPLSSYFSEFGYIQYRIKVEIEYFLYLCFILPELKEIYKKLQTSPNFRKSIIAIYEQFSVEDALYVKEIESRTCHDVKALELFIRSKFQEIQYSPLYDYVEYIHFGLTSQDINTTGLMLSVQDYVHNMFYSMVSVLRNTISNQSKEWNTIPMLARTHGQPATPTTLGKEFRVFLYRIDQCIETLHSITFYTKFGGCVGNLNAHKIAYPTIPWIQHMDTFISRFGLQRVQYSTQVGGYDSLCEFLHGIHRLMGIIQDMTIDCWLYISKDYFHQIRKLSTEIGSSTMPHKINPIHFENAEGNSIMAQGLIDCIVRRITHSRLQRDLTDSTIIRNIGTVFGHVTLATTSLLKGLNRIEPNRKEIERELLSYPVVVLEGVQTLLRKHKYTEAYDTVREFVVHTPQASLHDIQKFIQSLDVSSEIKDEMANLHPSTYTGYV